MTRHGGRAAHGRRFLAPCVARLCIACALALTGCIAEQLIEDEVEEPTIEEFYELPGDETSGDPGMSTPCGQRNGGTWLPSLASRNYKVRRANPLQVLCVRCSL